ncbi:MAG: efflux RND transporter periplasmic adaptor subunit [Desulfobacteraceae bacterium]|nr:MAG: efflux RND transporter periplasmic adaptor subunit [Desulfobacteraceae bacterium]
MNSLNKENNSDINRTLNINSKSGRGKHLIRWIVWLLIAVMAVFAVIKLGTGNSADKVEYKTESVQRGDLIVSVATTGTLQPTNQVEVGSELSGIIRTVEADYNDIVKIGQVLARLDTSRLEAQVQQSKASLEAAIAKVRQVQATVKEAGSSLNRLKQVGTLSGNRLSSQQDVDAAEAILERSLADETSARASVSQAEANLRIVQTDLSKAVIYSPIKGVVLKRSVEPGQTVAASLQAPVLFTLAEDLTKMELRVDVDEADVDKVKKNQKATFTVDGYPDRVFTAQITQVRYGSKIVSGVVTYEAILKVDNSDLSLRPGMTATANIVTNKIVNSVLIPNAALRFTPPAKENETLSGNSSIIGKLFPRPRRPQTKLKKETKADRKKARAWILKEGQLSEVSMIIGESDGIITEVISGGIDPGMKVIIDTVRTGQ